jgi:hypothetical protein
VENTWFLLRVKIHKVISDALLDYGRVTWNKCMKLIKKTPRVEKKNSRNLIRARLGTKLISSFVKWCYDEP